jgi:hypothetical protein
MSSPSLGSHNIFHHTLRIIGLASEFSPVDGFPFHSYSPLNFLKKRIDSINAQLINRRYFETDSETAVPWNGRKFLIMSLSKRCTIGVN